MTDGEDNEKNPGMRRPSQKGGRSGMRIYTIASAHRRRDRFDSDDKVNLIMSATSRAMSSNPT